MEWNTYTNMLNGRLLPYSLIINLLTTREVKSINLTDFLIPFMYKVFLRRLSSKIGPDCNE